MVITLSFFILPTLTLATPAAFNLEELTIQDIHTALKKREISCEQLMIAYLNRIKHYNLSIYPSAPFNAFTNLNPTLLDIARKQDHMLRNHQTPGPLHCIPVILKDNIDTYDIPATSGSFALLGNQPNQDAFLVEKLRQAGAIVIGHGTMDEFASGLSGISSRSGRTGNAYNSSKNPGGSSSGPAVAVSANFAVIGIGTDNSGSIRVPAVFNGVVGLRPSTGLISQKGIFPRGNLDGVPGPITRTVTDLAITLDIIAQPDPLDVKTLNIPRPQTYTRYLNKDGLKGKRIGIIDKVGNFEIRKKLTLSMLNFLNETQRHLTELGAQVIPDIQLPEFNSDRRYNQSGEVQEVNEYLASFPATRRNYQDICTSHRSVTFFDADKCLSFVKNNPKKLSRPYQNTLFMFEKNKQYVEKVMDHYKLDALLIPISASGEASYEVNQIFTWQAPVASNARLPAITMVIGYSDTPNKMPVGIELIAKQFNEGALIEIAYAYEQHSPKRHLPTMPEADKSLFSYDVSELNNLFTCIGSSTYNHVFKNHPSSEVWTQLTPLVFRNSIKHTLVSHCLFHNADVSKFDQDD